MAMLVPALAPSVGTLRVEGNTFVHFPQRRKILCMVLFQHTNEMIEIARVFQIQFISNFHDVVVDSSPNCTDLQSEHKIRNLARFSCKSVEKGYLHCDSKAENWHAAS